ncbi:hypothetical protein VCHA48O428_130079 [Vibrio chagasii]|nr:hypothetical protein VCHA48O428_130079 [Vibrio chagasii]
MLLIGYKSGVSRFIFIYTLYRIDLNRIKFDLICLQTLFY